MASHVPGIAITIKAFLPTGKTLDEQYAALTLVKEAHASGDYSEVLKTAKIDEVKAEQKTRRVDEAKTEPAADTNADTAGDDDKQMDVETYAQEQVAVETEQPDDAVPEFLKKGKKSA